MEQYCAMSTVPFKLLSSFKYFCKDFNIFHLSLRHIFTHPPLFYFAGAMSIHSGEFEVACVGLAVTLEQIYRGVKL